MMRLVLPAFVGASILASLPHYAGRIGDWMATRNSAEIGPSAEQAAIDFSPRGVPESRAMSARHATGRSMRLLADASGHFSGEFAINGRPIEGLVDTGATYVAMNQATARRLGVSPGAGEFVYEVETAAGRAAAARIVLDRVEIGPIRIDNVEAFVLSGSGLTRTLIGMSFMRRLEGYRVEDGDLYMMN